VNLEMRWVAQAMKIMSLRSQQSVCVLDDLRLSNQFTIRRYLSSAAEMTSQGQRANG
jgi:hypothetical protein